MTLSELKYVESEVKENANSVDFDEDVVYSAITSEESTEPEFMKAE